MDPGELIVAGQAPRLTCITRHPEKGNSATPRMLAHSPTNGVHSTPCTYSEEAGSDVGDWLRAEAEILAG